MELQLYTTPTVALEVKYSSDGPLDFGGLSFEYYIKKNLSLGASISYNKTKESLVQIINIYDLGVSSYDYQKLTGNSILNFFMRNYTENYFGWFYGAYIKYWMHYNKRLNTHTYPSEYTTYFINNRTPKAYRNHKISLGIIVGHKWNINRWTFSLMLGMGYSPGFLYFRQEKHFDKTHSGTTNLNADFGDRLSFVNHISVGFRF